MMRMKHTSAIILLISILAWSVIALAAAVQVAADEKPSWLEHADLMSMAIWGLSIIVVGLFARAGKKMEDNQGKLFKKIDDLCADFYELKGEHNAIKERCKK